MKKLILSSFVMVTLVLFSASDIFAQWTAQTSGITTRLRYVKAVDDNVVWACGASGVVLKSTNGGANWSSTTSPNAGSTIYTIDAFDATTAWVTGTVGGSADVSIWKTTDGGTTWTPQYNDPTGFGDALRMFDVNNGVYFGDPNTSTASKWELLTTSNGGSNWNRVPFGNYPAADSAGGEVGTACSMEINGNTVWFASYYSVLANDNIYKSTDKGLNWTKSSFTALAGGSSFIAFADQNNGVVMCLDNTTAKTTDGGATWATSSITGAGFRSVTNVPGTSNYLAVGSSGICYSSPDGTTWTAVTTGTTQSLYWIDATAGTAWAVGNAGTILKYTGPLLPVELTSFTAASQNHQVALNWATASELNNSGFEIQRKSNNSDFITVGFVKGIGTSTNQNEYSYLDKNLSDGIYSYRLKQVDFNGSFEYSNAIEVDVKSLDNYSLEQNYPNPFNPSTKIAFILTEKTNAKIVVMNAIGEEVAVLLNEVQEQGYHQVDFNASNLPSGIYFYTLQTGNFTATKKMILLK
jgi:photosystem II stability/assembly factor-like uncharacterized protein